MMTEEVPHTILAGPQPLPRAKSRLSVTSHLYNWLKELVVCQKLRASRRLACQYPAEQTIAQEEKRIRRNHPDTSADQESVFLWYEMPSFQWSLVIVSALVLALG